MRRLPGILLIFIITIPLLNFSCINNNTEAWSEKPYLPKVGIGFQSYFTEASKKVVESNKTASNLNQIIGPAFEAAGVEDNVYPDGMPADKAMEDLNRFSKTGEPFFLAVGFWKPHLPFNAPKNINVAEKPEYKNVVEKMSKILKEKNDKFYNE